MRKRELEGSIRLDRKVCSFDYFFVFWKETELIIRFQ